MQKVTILKSHRKNWTKNRAQNAIVFLKGGSHPFFWQKKPEKDNWKKLRYASYIRDIEQYHKWLYASVINLN